MNTWFFFSFFISTISSKIKKIVFSGKRSWPSFAGAVPEEIEKDGQAEGQTSKGRADDDSIWAEREEGNSTADGAIERLLQALQCTVIFFFYKECLSCTFCLSS